VPILVLSVEEGLREGGMFLYFAGTMTEVDMVGVKVAQVAMDVADLSRRTDNQF
jgi:cephalosporin hydroxylase